MWIARDKDNALNVFSRKPYRREENHCWLIEPKEECKNMYWYDAVIGEWMGIDDSLYTEVKWEDEPIEVRFHNNDKVEEFVKEFIGSLYDDLKKDEMTRDECVYFGTQCFMSHFDNPFNHLPLK